MEIPARADRRRQDDACGVQSLPDPQQVAAPRNFFNEDWCEALGAQLLVDAQEVDLGCVEDLLTHAEGDGHAGDEGDELAGFGGADADVPVWAPAGGEESPVAS